MSVATGVAALQALGLGYLGSMRILVLDDDAERAQAVCRQLAGAGFFRLEHVTSNAEALTLLEESRHDGAAPVDLMLVGESVLADPPGQLRELLGRYPAWRDIPLLGLVERRDGEQPLLVHATTPELSDLVVGGSEEDLTARVLAVLKQRERHALWARLNDLADGILMVLDPGGRVYSVNGGGAQQLGYRPDELAGRDWFETCLPVAEAGPSRETFERALERNSPDPSHSEQRVVTRDGEERLVAWRCVTWVDGAGRLRGQLCAGQDVTDRLRVSAQLSWHTSHDSLTGLLNRRELERRLAGLLERTREERSEHALICLDIDRFKIFNDTCGYEAGDQLLGQVGRLLSERVRSAADIARLGGDQFALLVAECSLAEARACGELVRGVLEDFRFPWDGRAHRVGASLGLVMIDALAESGASVLSAADAACHVAKQRGGNRLHVFQPDDEDLVARQGEMQWVLRINRALDEGRFQLWLQPIRTVGSGDHEHGELLLRMVDEDGGLILPGAFLPAAERFHLSTRIDRWVIRHAFAWMARNGGELARIRLCCINLSGLSLADESFLEFTIRELRRNRLDGGRICLEVTETAAIGNLSAAMHFMRALRAEGIRFALDDFGSGLSSFAYLKTLPVDYLKIDGVFVRDIDTDPIDFAMVRSIHEVARVMGKETIGEFVETAPVLQKLHDIGVDYAQGWGVGRPRLLFAGTGDSRPAP